MTETYMNIPEGIVVELVNRSGRDVISMRGTELPVWGPYCQYGLHVIYPGGNTVVIPIGSFYARNYVEFLAPPPGDWHATIVQSCPNLAGWKTDVIPLFEPGIKLGFLAGILFIALLQKWRKR